MTKNSIWKYISYLSACLGVLVFITGGLIYQNGRTFLEVSDFGWFFLPLAILALYDDTTKKFLLRYYDRLQTLLSRRTLYPTIALGGIMLVLFVSQTWGILNRYASFRGDWDLAIYANACANHMHSSLRDDASLMADHFEPLLALFIPLCERFDPAIVLLIVQSLSLILGGAGIFLLARALEVRPLLALVLAALYVNFPGNSTTLRYDFHLLALGMGTLPWLVYFAYKRSWASFFILACLHMGLKENASLTIAALGLFLCLRQRRTPGFATVLIGSIAFIVIMKIAFPYFRGGRESLYFQKYYGHLGANMEGVVLTAITKPLYFLSQIFTIDRITYVLKLFLPFFFIPFIAPVLALPVLPAIAINIMSSDRYLFGGGFHYQAEIYPLLFALTIWVIREWTHRPKLLYVWIAFLMICFSGKGLFTYTRTYAATDYQNYLAQKLRDLKPDLMKYHVSAVEKVATHLATIPQIYLLDQVDKADVVVIAYPQIDKRLWQISREDIENKLIPGLPPETKLMYQDNTYKDFRLYRIIRP